MEYATRIYLKAMVYLLISVAILIGIELYRKGDCMDCWAFLDFFWGVAIGSTGQYFASKQRKHHQ